VFDATDDDLTKGNSDNLLPLKQAIILETYSELLDILDNYGGRFGRGGRGRRFWRVQYE